MTSSIDQSQNPAAILAIKTCQMKDVCFMETESIIEWSTYKETN